MVKPKASSRPSSPDRRVRPWSNERIPPTVLGGDRAPLGYGHAPRPAECRRVRTAAVRERSLVHAESPVRGGAEGLRGGYCLLSKKLGRRQRSAQDCVVP